MASSKVMMRSRSPPNQDLPHHSSSSPLNLHSDQTRGLGSMNMEEILRNIYSDSDRNGGEASEGVGNGYGNKTMDEAWRDIVSGEQGMTLEDYLAKEGVVVEEEIRVPAAVDQLGIMSPADGVPVVQFGAVHNGGFGNGTVAVSGGRGRGKRRTVEEVQVDKVTQQKQRRMIKNRESAARSRERKQAYTVELESMVSQLEEENARLLKEEAELNKERYKQLMENLIPVVEKQRTPRTLRRIHSMQW